MLDKVTHIEGLEAYENVELYDDTNPGATQIKFEVVSEEMPYLTSINPNGTVERRNFVHIFKTFDLGRSAMNRRIKDTVEFDSVSNKWKVKKLAIGEGKSDIKKYPDAWNAFQRGVTADIVGTPIGILFKNDPSRAEMYKSKYVHTVEQLAELPDGNITDLGLGARDDRAKALNYLERIKAQAPALVLESKLAEKDTKIAHLQAQLSDLSEKLTALLTQQISGVKEKAPYTGKPRGRPKRVVEPVDVTPQIIEG